jgi:multidrug efflux pump
MNFTDLFIRRPVLSTVISLMILVVGLKALTTLPILQFPRTENAVVTVHTTYYGASADVVAGFITTPLESAIAQANGIDYMTSTSQTGQSTITVNLRLNYDSDKALTEISTKISSVLNQLPPQSQQPVLTVQIGQTIDAMYIGFNSDTLPQNNITDYLLRAVQPKLQAVEGVQTAEILGAQNFALRAWMDPAKLASYGLTASDVSNALAKNDYVSGLGSTKGQMVQITLNASTDLHSLEEFRNLIIKQKDGAIVRLRDVANVTLGSDDYESRVGFDGKQAVYIGIQVAPAANLLDVVAGVRKVYPDIQSQLPQGIQSNVVYDSTAFVKSSIHEVQSTLIQALIIVAIVVFMFLGSPRSVAIPIIAIPLSLIGAFIFMLVLNFSINLLTLLALVLGIGLVVDDAIIVVENVNRHIEEGMKPVDAAYKAAQELAGPIVAMTIVLIAVYVPIGFQGGLTGALFTEFAFTLVGAVTISAVVALTLSPMMCAHLLKPHLHDDTSWEARLVEWLDKKFESLRHRYEELLQGSLNFIPVTMVFAAIVLGSIYFLYSLSKTELAPQEDQGVVISAVTAAPSATLQQRLMYDEKVYKIFAGYPETGHVFQLDTPGSSIAGAVLKPWDERSRTSNDLQPIIQNDLSGIAGVRAAAFQPPPLPGPRGLPIQFVIQTTQPFERLDEISQAFMQEAQKSGMFIFLDNDLKIDRPQATVQIDRDKTAQFGLTMNDVGASLSSMLGGGYVNYFSLSGRSYKVIPQVAQSERLNTDQLNNYYVRTAEGTPIALSTLAHIVYSTVPESLNHFQQQNAATISGVAMPGVAAGDAIHFLTDLAHRTLPQGYVVDYGGQSRQFAQESSGFIMTFVFALIIIFLTLAAQFESFRDPLIILISVPMSIAGALIFICIGVGGASINIYTQVGLVTLMGLISKHGILITEFANKLQHEGRSKKDAIIEATAIRLRPILMTTAAMVLGVVPLIVSSGAGALSRFNMGLVIASGLSIGTLFTLFVVPAVYMILAEDHHDK